MTSPGTSLVKVLIYSINVGDIEDQVVQRALLHNFAVQPRLDAQDARIGYFICCDQPRAESAGADEILSWEILRGMALPFPDAAVVVAGVSRDIVVGIRLLHMAGRLADDEREFAFEVEGFRYFWPDHWLTMPDLCVAVAREQAREFRQLVCRLPLHGRHS